MSSLSTHVLDLERGSPAAGVPVRLYRGDQLIGEAATNADGRVADVAGGEIDQGTYRLVFDVGHYFAAGGRSASFLDRVAVDFRVDGSERHYHVPLLLAPYGCTTYRGS